MRLFFVLGLISLFSFSTKAQGFTPPAEGNAVVYFARVTVMGAAVSFEYFHNEKFIGVFKGKNYMRYELPAGKHLLWASSENKEFLECDLKAGGTYLVLVNIQMGAWKARMDLEPVLVDNKDFERVKELIMSKEPITTPDKVIAKTEKKLEEKGFVKTIMERFEKDWKSNPGATRQITQDMAIPDDKLK
ncbi:MAG: hypothetical protein JW717_05615 [Marinilabiliaceae bacterium]|nr:hypothetical protein [Marinilabiliaceae bacterium]